MLPRLGGVLDQPNLEMRKLETILLSFASAEELEETRNKTRKKNRGKHGS